MHRTIKELLDRPPSRTALLGTVEYVPIGTVELQLDEVFDLWEIKKFTLKETILSDGEFHVSGTITLIVWHNNNISRTLKGAYSTIFDRTTQFDVAGIVKSECIKNAAKCLGTYFGRGLNGRLDADEIHNIESEGIDPILPDDDTAKQYLQYLKNK